MTSTSSVTTRISGIGWKKIFILTFAIFLTQIIFAQKKLTVSGTVRSADKGETLIGATVRMLNGTSGTVTNEYGFYSLLLDKGEWEISFSALGMKSKTIKISLQENVELNVELEVEAASLEEVVITASNYRRSLRQPQMGMEKLSITDIQNLPVLLGEKDALKILQLLPGIKSAGDGNSGFYVRGGAADQNLILLDEAPVYNASHLLGFFSTFNSDAIKDITVYKGGMPAQYGGRLASVLDIHMNDGNSKNLSVSGGIGLISTRLNVEGPIQKDQSSFLLSGRRTYADMFLKLSSDTTISKNKLYFYDFNAKLNYTLSKKDRLFLSGYFGRDKVAAGENFGLSWGNATATLRWNHLFSSRLFSNTSLIYSNYDYLININTSAAALDIVSNIKDWNLKQELQWNAGNKHQVRFGFQSIYHRIQPGEVKPGESSPVNPSVLQTRYSWDNAIYLSDTWKFSDKIQLGYGLRVTFFSILGDGDFFNIDADGNILDTLSYGKGEFVKTYVNAEPRISISYSLNDFSSIKASYVRNTQNLHLLSNSVSSSPTDKWIASTNIVKPQIADQYAVGYYRNFSGGAFEFSSEAYYKSMQNQIDYRDGADIFANSDAIERQLLFGIGRAYGWENLIKKTSGAFSGWISYTLSRTEKQINGINNGNWYNARQDRTHDIALVGMYKLNEKWTLSANWVYYTGDAVTFPTGKYTIDNQTIFYYSERNGYRMPDYHRLDLGAVLVLKKTEKRLSELAFSLYNAYGRENAYTISFRDSEENPGTTEAVQVALFKFIPSITWNFKF
ncbi:MAG TPA: TonB-dependent receptor [Parasegetibacter sp.]